MRLTRGARLNAAVVELSTSLLGWSVVLFLGGMLVVFAVVEASDTIQRDTGDALSRPLILAGLIPIALAIAAYVFAKAAHHRSLVRLAIARAECEPAAIPTIAQRTAVFTVPKFIGGYRVMAYLSCIIAACLLVVCLFALGDSTTTVVIIVCVAMLIVGVALLAFARSLTRVSTHGMDSLHKLVPDAVIERAVSTERAHWDALSETPTPEWDRFMASARRLRMAQSVAGGLGGLSIIAVLFALFARMPCQQGSLAAALDQCDVRTFGPVGEFLINLLSTGGVLFTIAMVALTSIAGITLSLRMQAATRALVESTAREHARPTEAAARECLQQTSPLLGLSSALIVIFLATLTVTLSTFMMRDSVAIKASLLTLAPALAVTAVVALVLAVWLSMAGLATTEKRQREFRDAWWPGDLDAPAPDPDDEVPAAP